MVSGCVQLMVMRFLRYTHVNLKIRKREKRSRWKYLPFVMLLPMPSAAHADQTRTNVTNVRMRPFITATLQFLFNLFTRVAQTISQHFEHTRSRMQMMTISPDTRTQSNK